MWLHNWVRSRKRLTSLPIRSARCGKARTTRLFLEPLEDRTLPSAGWAIATGGSGGLSNSTAPALSQPDAAGNLYVTGYFNGTVAFGSTTLTASSNNTSFVAKVDATGNVLWAEQFGGLAGGNWTGIAVDGSGNVYLSGNFDGTQSFGGTTLTSPSGSATGYICKVDPNGNFLWAKEYAYQNSGYGDRMAVDGSGNAYLSWYAAPPSSPTGYVGFLSKWDSSGNLLWSQQLDSGATNVFPHGVALDSSGNAYVGGEGAHGNSAGFLASFDPNGNVIWSEAMPRPILGEAIYQNPTTGTNWLYTAVWPTTAMPTDVQKIDAASGTVLWSEQIGSPSVRPYAVAVDASGNPYLSGGFGGSVDFDPGPGTATLTAQTGDVFVVKLDPSGNFLSVYSFGGTNTNEGSYGLALDSSGNIYTAGSFGGTSNFDTGSQIVSLTSSGSGNSLYVAKTTQDTGMIFGRVFNDLNNNGVFDAGSLESGIPNVTVYLDLNNSGSYVAGDPTAITDSQGYYHFTDVAPGNYAVRQIVPSGYTATPASMSVSVSAGLGSETTAFADHTPNTTRTYSNSTAVRTSRGKPNAVSSLTVSDSYTVLGMTLALNVSNNNHNNLSIFLTGPNGTKIALGSTTQSGALSFQVPYFDYTAVKGTWTIEVDGLTGGTLNGWSMNIDGTMS